ncbi:MAG: twin-arginine translocase subunit TatB [Alphaproteobacteria bacterium]|nr:twin-arginine translocase subunit TatB [Alphaproteobacteria bacterium]PPR13343.1 MAG: Sec-independent protein translocase protein TatB [Alphaproteobacteria bacterium MarineAlpha12_Bin1]|tara:strand:+ start:3356 stop:3781 length:426 start_codon:yes stop_codon:yes gene_type:complete
MFDIGWPELMLIMVVGLIVIGPKDLPAAIRTVTTIIRKMRGLASEFQDGLESIARESGIDEAKKSVDDIISYDPKAALDNIKEMESGDFILDPVEQSLKLENDPDASELDSEEIQETDNVDNISENEGQTNNSANTTPGAN